MSFSILLFLIKIFSRKIVKWCFFSVFPSVGIKWAKKIVHFRQHKQTGVCLLGFPDNISKPKNPPTKFRILLHSWQIVQNFAGNWTLGSRRTCFKIVESWLWKLGKDDNHRVRKTKKLPLCHQVKARFYEIQIRGLSSSGYYVYLSLFKVALCLTAVILGTNAFQRRQELDLVCDFLKGIPGYLLSVQTS